MIATGIDDERTARGVRGLSFPFAAAPAPGEAIEVAEGVLWLRLPLPWALPHVNVFALRDEGGWAVVDTGLDIGDHRDLWERALKGPLEGGPVTRVILTHMHPDHSGLAGWLCRRFDAPLLMTRTEYFQCRVLIGDKPGAPPPAFGEFQRRAGWTPEQRAAAAARFGMFGKMVVPPPESYERLKHGGEIMIGGRLWRIAVGAGHSPEHACLVCEELALTIVGDQILPSISPNVSVYPTEPDADPMSEWLSSLRRLPGDIPDHHLALPSHGDPFRGIHARAAQIVERHEKAIARLYDLLDQPKRAVETFSALFKRPVDDAMIGLATGEAVASLNCMIGRGLVRREKDDEDVYLYERAH